MEGRKKTKQIIQIMNNTKTTDVTEDNSMNSIFWAFLNYAMNKYMPILMISFICFYSLGFSTWEPYFVMGLVLFSNKFNFDCGYASSCVDIQINNFKKEDYDKCD